MKIGYLMQLGAEIRRPPYNGPANHVRHVVEELAELGHEVCILFRLEGQIWFSRDLEHFETVHVPWIDAGPLRWLEKGVRKLQSKLRLPYANLFESLRFAGACRRVLGECDLFYERTSWMGFGGAIAARWMGIPLFLEDNGDHLDDLEAKEQAPAGFQRRLSLMLMGWGIRQSTFTISSGDGWRKRFINRWKYPEEKIATVENGTMLVRLLSRADLASFTRVKSAEEPLQLVYLGGFYAWHGVPVLLNAFSRAVRENSKLRLLLIGSGDGFQAAFDQSKALGLAEFVTFAGHLPQSAYAQQLAQADIGLSPYCGWAEFSGLKIFDYMAAGLPTIASGKDGMPATLEQGRTGWIISPCSEDALQSAILELASNRERLRKMGQAARLEAETRHDWRHTAHALETIFSNVLAGNSGSYPGRLPEETTASR
jgi:alpha-maltose-1-phosphate synthase